MAAECSLSGSKNMSGSPQRFLSPFMTAALKPPPIVVELVIGIGAGGLADLDLDVDDRLGAVARHRHSRERKMATVRSIQVRGQRSELLDLCNGAHTDLAGGILPGVLPGTGCRTNREG